MGVSRSDSGNPRGVLRLCVVGMILLGTAAPATASPAFELLSDRRHVDAAGFEASPPVPFANWSESVDTDGFLAEQTSAFPGSAVSGEGRAATPGAFVNTPGDPEAFSDVSFELRAAVPIALHVEATLTVTDPDAFVTFSLDAFAWVRVTRLDGPLPERVFEREPGFPQTITVDETVMLEAGDYTVSAGSRVQNFEAASAEWQATITVSDPREIPATSTPLILAGALVAASLLLQGRRCVR